MNSPSDDIFDRLRAVEDDTLRNDMLLSGHERECSIRYAHINASVDGIRRDMRNAATAGAGLMIAVLAFLIKLVFFPT